MLGKKKVDPQVDLQSRRAILWMDPTAILPLMTSHRWVIVEGTLPEDVTFHSVFWDQNRLVFGIICQSKTFDSLKLAEEMPHLPPVSFRYYDGKKDGVIK